MAVRENKTLNSPWPKDYAIVYGLHAPAQKIVYVGATRNAKRRFAAYRSPSDCHNSRLQAWLIRQSQVCVAILHEGEDCLFEAERKEIQARTGLFNLHRGGDQSWRERVSKPWMAKTGVQCPSALGLQLLAKAKHPQHGEIKKLVSKRRAEMSDTDRVMYEVGLATSFPQTNALKKWLSMTAGSLLAVLESIDAQ